MGVNLPGADRSIARQTALHAGRARHVHGLHRRPRLLLVADRAHARPSRRAERRRRRSPSPAAARTSAVCRTSSTGIRFGRRIGDIVLDRPADHQLPATPAWPAPCRRGRGRALRHRPRSTRTSGRCAATNSARRGAQRSGLFDDEIVPVVVDAGSATGRAATNRPGQDTTLARLAELPTVNGSATVTAGNAPGLSTGASFVVVAPAGAEADRRGDRCSPRCCRSDRPPGTRRRSARSPPSPRTPVLERAGLQLDDVDLIEINEAFAAVPW